MARRITRELVTGWPSSEIATAPGTTPTRAIWAIALLLLGSQHCYSGKWRKRRETQYMKIPFIEKAALISLLAGGLLVGAQIGLPLMGASAPASPRACRVPGWSM